MVEDRAIKSRRQKKKNILILVDTLEVYGGSERHVLDLVKHLDKNKYSLFVSSLIPGEDLLKEIASFGACVKLFPLKRIYSIFGIWRGFQFARFLRRNKIDILMTIHFGSDIWGTIFGRQAGVPVVISNRRDMGFWKKRRHIIAYKLINRFVDTMIVNSQASKNRIIEDENVPAEKVKVIHGAVDICRFSPPNNNKKIKQKLGISSDRIIIGSVGNFNSIKGHRFLIEAMPGILRKIPKTHFLLVGDGPLKESLQSTVQSLQLGDNITFLGSRNDIPDILSIMDICVLPSLSEGLSNALMEYMAAGKPIIATNVGGNPELIENGVSGVLIRPGMADEIEKAVIELATNKDKALRLAANALRKAENEIDMSSMIKKYEDILSGKKRKRILHLISSNGLFGAEKVLLNIAHFNQLNGTDVIVACVHNSHNPHIEVADEASKNDLKTKILRSNGRLALKTVRQLRNYIKVNNIDIIHTHNYKSDAIGFLASRFTKTRWIATNHVWHGNDVKLKVYELLDSLLLRFADKIVAVSDEIREDLLRKRIKADKIERIFNGIDVSGIMPTALGKDLKAEFGINNGDIVVTTVGRLSPEKGHAVLLEAAEKVIKKHNNVKFLIVGDGPLRESLQPNVRSRQLEKYIKFLGIREDVSEILSISDIYVNSSYIEGLPLTILEAMRSRLPVVATNSGGTPQVISEGKTGILVNSGNSEELKNAIEMLISDAKRRQKLGNEAYKDLCERFSIERMGESYSKVYDEVLT
jgi:glycosyltransferase involved in cell wall biosynthesis